MSSVVQCVALQKPPNFISNEEKVLAQIRGLWKHTDFLSVVLTLMWHSRNRVQESVFWDVLTGKPSKGGSIDVKGITGPLSLLLHKSNEPFAEGLYSCSSAPQTVVLASSVPCMVWWLSISDSETLMAQETFQVFQILSRTGGSSPAFPYIGLWALRVIDGVLEIKWAPHGPAGKRAFAHVFQHCTQSSSHFHLFTAVSGSLLSPCVPN